MSVVAVMLCGDLPLNPSDGNCATTVRAVRLPAYRFRLLISTMRTDPRWLAVANPVLSAATGVVINNVVPSGPTIMPPMPERDTSTPVPSMPKMSTW